MGIPASNALDPELRGSELDRVLVWSRTHLGTQPLTSRNVAFDVAAAVVIGFLSVVPLGFPAPASSGLVVLAGVLGVAVRRWQPALALALCWICALLQIGFAERPSIIEIAMLVVLYTAAAYGRRLEFIASAVSAGLGGLIGGMYLLLNGTIGETVSLAGILSLSGLGRLAAYAVVSALPLVAFAVSWLIGLSRRSTLASQSEAQLRVEAEASADRARDAVQMEHVRTAMARDVHDVVGHSLAVIIAQADSIQFIDDPEAVRGVVSTIARTARGSLAEVRAVIGATDGVRVTDPGDLDSLLDPVRATGARLEHAVRGEPRALGTDVAVVARRILQEMLTNALRHGRTDEPLEVRFTWRSDDLVLEVENVVGDAVAVPGSGIEGMQTRLAGIGGTLDAGRVDDRFVARARLPYIATATRP